MICSQSSLLTLDSETGGRSSTHLIDSYAHKPAQSTKPSANSNRMPSSTAKSTSASSSSALPVRPRHHSRSVSQEAARFTTSTIESFHLAPPRRPSHANGSHISFRPVPSSSSSAPTSKVTTPIHSPPHTSPTISSSSADSNSSTSTITQQSQPHAAPPPQQQQQPQLWLSAHQVQSTSASTVSSPHKDRDSVPSRDTAPPPVESSPSRKRAITALPAVSARSGTSATSSTNLPSDDETRLQHLLHLQASRRPKLLRLTPAFGSLPGKLSPSQSSSDGLLAFPKMESSLFQASSAGSPATSDPRKNLKDSGKIEPPEGLLSLDMSNLPTPSARDSSAPQSTSDLPEVRTKSGRLIKPSLKHSGSNWSPASYTGKSGSAMPAMSSSVRAKSTPNTPSIPKVVQFDPQLERIKVFKFKQRPTAISRSGSPEQTETETEEEREMFPFVNYGRRGNSPPTSGFTTPSHSGKHINSNSIPPSTEAEEQLVLRLPNFPSSARLTVDREVYLERIYLAEDLRSVKGTVRVKNISFEKWVAVRFTLDSWTTVNEVSAEYSESLTDGQSDRFSFSIKLNELLNWPRGAGQHESKTMFLCLRYTTGSGEFWDNNDGLNYQLDFRKRQLPSTPTPTPAIARPSSRSQTISGPSATAQQARIIEMAKRNGVQAGKGGSFVDDLRRELDKLRSDGEEDDRPPIVTKKMVAEVALGKQAGQRNSPPLSPGARRAPGSPMWSARYDWGESFRNSSSNGSRSRPPAYDYFNAKPPPPSAAVTSMMANDASEGGAPAVQVGEGSNSHDTDSADATPLIRAFGQTRAGMFSPAVGDVYAHHQPLNPSSVDSSAASSPSKNFGNLAVPSRDGRSSPGNGFSPTLRARISPNSDKFFSFPPHRKLSSPYPSEPNSLDGSDEEEDQANPQYARSPAVRISTMPKSSLKNAFAVAGGGGSEKDDGMVLENYDAPSPASPTHPSPPSPSMFSPSASISSVESDITVSEEGNKPAGDESPTTATPRLASRRRWSPPTSSMASFNELQPSNASLSFGAAAAARAPSPEQERGASRPRSAAELSELIQKYCWSSETTPGTAALPDASSGVAGGAAGQKLKRTDTMTSTMTPSTSDLFSAYRLSSPPISGSATPTLDL